MIDAATEWKYLRCGLLAVALLAAAAAMGWGIYEATYEPVSPYVQMRKCLRYEKRLPILRTRDPIALSADLGALRTVIETNGVTVAVTSSEERAERIVAAYHAVGGDLTGRLERRDTTVYLFDGPAEPTHRQTLFDCTY